MLHRDELDQSWDNLDYYLHGFGKCFNLEVTVSEDLDRASNE